MILFALYFLLCLVYLFLPLFGGIFLLIFSLRFKKYLSVTLLFVSFSFSLLAFCADSSGLISTDLERYRAQYLTYVGSPFGWLFSVNIIFDSITWLFANYVSDNVRFVGMIWVFISNIFLMFSVRKLLEYFIPSLRRSVQKIARDIKPYKIDTPSKIDEATNTLTEKYIAEIEPLIRHFKRELMQEQSKLDNQTNYQMENDLCRRFNEQHRRNRQP